MPSSFSISESLSTIFLLPQTWFRVLRPCARPNSLHKGSVGPKLNTTSYKIIKLKKIEFTFLHAFPMRWLLTGPSATWCHTFSSLPRNFCNSFKNPFSSSFLHKAIENLLTTTVTWPRQFHTRACIEYNLYYYIILRRIFKCRYICKIGLQAQEISVSICLCVA